MATQGKKHPKDKLRAAGTHLTRAVFNLLAGGNLCTILLLLLCAYGGILPPSIFPHLALAPLLFPVFLILNTGFVLFWLIFHPRYVWLPLVGFLLCICQTRDYIPINLPADDTDSTLRVLSFNVHNYVRSSNQKVDGAPFASYLADCQADLICLQESGTDEKRTDSINTALKATHPYTSTTMETRCEVRLYSRYPILKVEHPLTSNNRCSIYWIQYGSDTIVVVNNHLQSNTLTPKEKSSYRQLFDHPNEDSIRSTGHTLVSKIADKTQHRAQQADSISQFIQPLKAHPLIICGDFNDIPLAYSVRTIGQGLHNAFTRRGNGFGFTFKQSGIWVRIDHLFYNDFWQAQTARIDYSFGESDHFPLIVTLKKQGK